MSLTGCRGEGSPCPEDAGLDKASGTRGERLGRAPKERGRQMGRSKKEIVKEARVQVEEEENKMQDEDSTEGLTKEELH